LCLFFCSPGLLDPTLCFFFLAPWCSPYRFCFPTFFQVLTRLFPPIFTLFFPVSHILTIRFHQSHLWSAFLAHLTIAGASLSHFFFFLSEPRVSLSFNCCLQMVFFFTRATTSRALYSPPPFPPQFYFPPLDPPSEPPIFMVMPAKYVLLGPWVTLLFFQVLTASVLDSCSIQSQPPLISRLFP